MSDTGDLVDAVLREIRLHAGASHARQSPERGEGSYQVVVVDDDENTRVLYAESLHTLGFRVRTAAGAFESLTLARTHRPDIIVMDYAMPGADGGEAVRMLAEDPRSRGIPVVMVTASVDLVPKDTRTRCAAVLAKPCAVDELAYLLRLVIDARAEKAP
jgi:CheY-like chemotaxis protein